MEQTINRRLMLRRAIKYGTTALAGVTALRAQANSAVCNLTADQPEGPFYPIFDQPDTDNNLTQLNGSSKMAKGEIVILAGTVMNQNCKPVKGALVEIWQACSTGKYDHPSDPNSAPLDPDFQYWGKAITNENGEYSFKTIKPGKYRASSSWVRPPHIHLKTHLRGHIELTTQVYFEEDMDLNAKDRILQALTPQERANVICKFSKESPNEFYRKGNFNITLKSL